MSDIITKLKELNRQATEERSHYYVGSVVCEAIAEIMRLRDAGGFSHTKDELKKAIVILASHVSEVP